MAGGAVVDHIKTETIKECMDIYRGWRNLMDKENSYLDLKVEKGKERPMRS